MPHPFGLAQPTENQHSGRECHNPEVGCAEQREAHRSRLMRLLASAHPTGSESPFGISPFVGIFYLIVSIRCSSKRNIVIKIVKLGGR